MIPKNFNLDIDGYFGGKNGSGTYQTIINQVPPHRRKICGFLGGGGVMNRIKPAAQNLGFELDEAVFLKWKKVFTTSKREEQFRVLNTDFLSIMEEWGNLFDKKTFLYLDPPYLHSTLKSLSRYNFQMTNVQHQQLLNAIKKMDCMVAISTYPNTMYEKTLKDWRLITFESMTQSGKMATEHLYMNYPEPTKLHDYRFLGNNFRERDDLKRRMKNIFKKIEKMPTLEREWFFEKMKTEYPETFSEGTEKIPLTTVIGENSVDCGHRRKPS